IRKMLHQRKAAAKGISMSTQMVPMHSPEGESSSNTTFGSKRFVRFGAFHLDLKKEELYKDGARVKLQGKVYQALVALLQKAVEALSGGGVPRSSGIVVSNGFPFQMAYRWGACSPNRQHVVRRGSRVVRASLIESGSRLTQPGQLSP